MSKKYEEVGTMDNWKHKAHPNWGSATQFSLVIFMQLCKVIG